MTDILVEVGEQITFSKTVSESDIYLFAGITGDFSGNHVNEEFMRTSAYGQRVAHGALLVGFMSTTSSMLIDKSLQRGTKATPVSLGYDRVRFLSPVFIGDTITIDYVLSEVDRARARTVAHIEIRKQDGTVVAVADHILKWLARVSVENAAE